MAQPKPIDNPEYTKLLFLIGSGIDTPKAIAEHFKKRSMEVKVTNVSMKLKQLKKLGFISNERLRSIKGSSTSEYRITVSGIFEYILTEMLKSEDKMKKEIIPKNTKLTNLLFLYLCGMGKRLEPNYGKSIKSLLHDFIMGIGLNLHQKYAIAEYKILNLGYNPFAQSTSKLNFNDLSSKIKPLKSDQLKKKAKYPNKKLSKSDKDFYAINTFEQSCWRYFEENTTNNNIFSISELYKQFKKDPARIFLSKRK